MSCRRRCGLCLSRRLGLGWGSRMGWGRRHASVSFSSGVNSTLGVRTSRFRDDATRRVPQGRAGSTAGGDPAGMKPPGLCCPPSHALAPPGGHQPCGSAARLKAFQALRHLSHPLAVAPTPRVPHPPSSRWPRAGPARARAPGGALALWIISARDHTPKGSQMKTCDRTLSDGTCRPWSMRLGSVIATTRPGPRSPAVASARARGRSRLASPLPHTPARESGVAEKSEAEGPCAGGSPGA